METLLFMFLKPFVEFTIQNLLRIVTFHSFCTNWQHSYVFIFAWDIFRLLFLLSTVKNFEFIDFSMMGTEAKFLVVFVADALQNQHNVIYIYKNL